MIFSFKELEFERILDYISKYSLSEEGKEIIKNIRPFEDLNKCLLEGKLTQEAKEILIKTGDFPLDYLLSLKDKIYKSSIEGSILEAKDLKEINRLAKFSRAFFNYLKANSEAKTLCELFLSNLFVDKNFENQIDRVIDEDCAIKITSSKKLKEIRDQILEKSETLRKIISLKLKSLSENYLAREEYVTLRDGRMVLPIKVEHKRKVKGFIHSESATGQTVYIEPEETLELNNDIVSLQFEEKREIERLLRELTKLVGANKDSLLNSYNALIKLDVIFAKAKYSIETISSFPSFEKSKSFEIIEGRHPILYKKLGRDKTIPLNFKKEQNSFVIIITGPNAGGKTATIKTIGLLCLMAQSGIHIPCSPDSNLHFFENILADIGDSQSIEDDLSAFSSKLLNYKRIIESANENTLVLLDELGGATDPSEGAALAGAILMSLKEKKSLTLATTHLGDLKILANSESGFENASMEFDSENLVPTYRFRQGFPGSSFAFEIAKRIGLEEKIIQMANQLLDKDRSKVEHFIADLEGKIRIYAQKISEAEEENRRLIELTQKYKNLAETLRKEKAKILEEAKNKGEEFLKRANKEIEKAIKQIKENGAEKNVIAEAKKTLIELQNEFEEIKDEANQSEDALQEYKPKIGDYVCLKGSKAIGQVKEINEEKKIAYVTLGGLKVMCKYSDLSPTSKEDFQKITTSQKKFEIEISAPKSFALDLRGLRYSEAETEIIKFIDQSFASGLDKIEIIHGKGNGVLKKLTWDILKKDYRVKNFYFAPIEIGGDGVTIAEFI